MFTEIVAAERADEYISLLTFDEYSGIISGRFTCFGAYDEEEGAPAGILVAEVLPGYIRIENVYTVSRYQNKGIAKGLLKSAMDIPEPGLPFFVFVEDVEADVGFFIRQGFKKEKSNYCYLTGKLSDLEDFYISDSVKSEYEILYMDEISGDGLSEYIGKVPHDSFFAFPGYVDLTRFSDGSLICRHEGKICGVLMLEELFEGIQVTFLHADDTKALCYLLTEFYGMIEEEYSEKASVRFLSCNESEEEGIKKYFKAQDKLSIGIFKG